MALLLGAVLMGSSGLSATARSLGDETAGGLLTADQGEMLVDFVLHAGANLRSKPDCSHLVHLLYSRAGLSYPYQPSRALYVGIEDFQRVRTPQPGDLIVWRGHVGIVVSREEKTFFSSVRSGIITESWTADHWLVRGHPRFYRYRLGPDSNPALLASLKSDDLLDGGTTAAIQETDDSESDDARDTKFSDDTGPTGSVSRDTRAGQSVRDSTPSPNNANVRVENSAKAAESQDSSTSIVALIKSKKPGKQEIVSAFMQASNIAARKLSAGDSPVLSSAADRPVSVFTHAEVSRLKIKHNSGTVTFKLTETILLEQGRVLPAKTTERELSIYRSAANGSTEWIISDPHQRLYVPQTQALSLFQHQAELLLHRSPNSPAARAAVKALNVLYDQQPVAQRASLK